MEIFTVSCWQPVLPMIFWLNLIAYRKLFISLINITDMQRGIVVNEEFRALQDATSIFVGRKISVYEEHKTKAAMDIGIMAEERSDSREVHKKRVLMDSISPHAVFICGMRGSGKSYTLGVIAEELALKNDAVGVIIIDPMGIFWSMKSPNTVDREQTLLKEWNLSPKGIKSVRVFVPAGYSREAPKATWDKIFTIRPSELTADDWCLTFGFDRFDTMGLLIDRVLEKVKEGYTTKEGQTVKGIKDTYGIPDMIACIESEEGIQSRNQGFKNSTRRALIARLKGAVEWGIFDREGTQLRDLSRRGHISVIDVSFLQDNVRALVVGILARNILNARKRTSRKEAAGFAGLLESIPVTWLMIDEAHILVPGSGRKTAATDALIEYVRQGRQPGCSIVLATQQPSAIDSRILSQVDMVACHKLVYEDDIKAVLRRMPSEVPERFQEDHFIKNLPIGMAILGDKQEETSRCFLVSVRPRISQHEGRERQPILDVDPDEMRKNVKGLIKEKWGKETIDSLEKLIKSINQEYKLHLSLSELLDELAEEGLIETELEAEEPAPREEKEGEEEEPTRNGELPHKKPGDRPSLFDVVNVEVTPPVRSELHPRPPTITSPGALEIPEPVKDLSLKKARVILSEVDDHIEDIALRRARRMLLKKDTIHGIFKIYYPVYQVFFDYYPPKGKYQSLSCFVDGITGEVMIGKGKRTRGVRDLMNLSPDQRTVMIALMKKRSAALTDLMKATHFDKRKVKRIMGSLIQKGLVEIKKHKKLENKSFEIFQSRIQYRIIDDPRKKIKRHFQTDEEYLDKESMVLPTVTEKEAKKAAEVWERSVVWDTGLLYYPYFLVSYENRYEIIDGVTGKEDEYIKSMLTFRL
jgi:predicted transcriptional regulator